MKLKVLPGPGELAVDLAGSSDTMLWFVPYQEQLGIQKLEYTSSYFDVRPRGPQRVALLVHEGGLEPFFQRLLTLGPLLEAAGVSWRDL